MLIQPFPTPAKIAAQWHLIFPLCVAKQKISMYGISEIPSSLLTRALVHGEKGGVTPMRNGENSFKIGLSGLSGRPRLVGECVEVSCN